MTTGHPPKARPRPLDSLARAVKLATTEPPESIAAADDLLARSRLKPGLRSDALKARGIALLEAGEPVDALQSLADATDLARQAGDPQRVARCLINRGIALATLGRRMEALEAHSEALASSGSTSSVAAVACINLGLLAERLDERALACDYARLAFRLLPEGTPRRASALNIGVALCRQEQWAQARPYLELAVDGTSATAQRGYHLVALSSLAVVESRLGNIDAAMASLRSLIEDARSSGLERIVMSSERSLLEMLVRTRRLQEAVDLGRRWLERYAATDDLQLRDVQWWLAEAWQALGDAPKALELVRQWSQWRQQLACDAEIATVRHRLHVVHAQAEATMFSPSDGEPRYVAVEAVGRQHGLSAVDLDVLRHIAEGATNQAIAAATRSTLPAVRNRISRMLPKMGVSNRAAAARRALELGMLRMRMD